MILYVALVGLGVAGLAIGRWWALGLPLVIVPVIYVGLDRGWWGSGLGDGWEYAAAFVLAVALALAGAGVLTRRLVRRGAMAVRGS